MFEDAKEEPYVVTQHEEEPRWNQGEIKHLFLHLISIYVIRILKRERGRGRGNNNNNSVNYGEIIYVERDTAAATMNV